MHVLYPSLAIYTTQRLGRNLLRTWLLAAWQDGLVAATPPRAEVPSQAAELACSLT